MAIKDYNTDPNANTSISGIDISEGCAPGNINDAIRQNMADTVAGDFGDKAVRFDNIIESTAQHGTLINDVLLQGGAVSPKTDLGSDNGVIVVSGAPGASPDRAAAVYAYGIDHATAALQGECGLWGAKSKGRVVLGTLDQERVIVEEDGTLKANGDLSVSGNLFSENHGFFGSSATGYLRVPRGTDAQRPDLNTAQQGIRWNTTNAQFEGWDGNAWVGLGGGGWETVYVETNLASATAHEFRTRLPLEYDEHRVLVEEVVGDSATLRTLWTQVSTGTTWWGSSLWSYSYIGHAPAASTPHAAQNTLADYAELTGREVYTTVGIGNLSWFFDIRLIGFNQSHNSKTLISFGNGRTAASNGHTQACVGATFNSTARPTDFRLSSSAPISIGRIIFLGRKN